MTRSETKAWLDDAHRRRLNAGRAQNAHRRERIAAAEAAGHAWEAEMLSRQFYRRSAAFVRAQRRREEVERERDRRRVGAAVRRAQRELDRFEKSGSARLFEFEPARSGTRMREGRDLYWEWISRGFEAGRKRNYKKNATPRIQAREAKWSDGEFQDKIVYIEREDALEDVPGNVISNMGVDQAERLGCAGQIEELERLSRKDAGVYVHSILALPADLSPEGRASLLKGLCGHYERLGLPFSAALHKPDPDNSQKNFHAHILVSLRPMQRVADRWEFAATKLTWLGTPAGLKLQRRLIARAFNKALVAEKVATRWTHRSRAADGLAPGGFTKRGGVNRSLPVDPDVEDVLAARASVEETEALDEAVRMLERVVGQLESCEAELGRLADRSEGRDAAVLSDVGQGAAPHQPSTPAKSRSAAPAEVVANSQPGKPVGPKDGLERTPNRTLTGSVPQREHPEPAAAEARDTAPPSTPPHPLASPDPTERRRRKLAKARQRMKQQDFYAALVPGDRMSLDADLDAISPSFGDGSAVVAFMNGALQLSASDDALIAKISAVANSQPGWMALRKLAEAIAELAPPHHHPPVILANPADDWPPGFDPRGKGRGR